MIDPIATGNRIRMYMKLQHLSVQYTADALSLECVQSVYHWLNGRSLPSVDNLYLLSRLLHVHMEDLIVARKYLSSHETMLMERTFYYQQLLQA